MPIAVQWRIDRDNSPVDRYASGCMSAIVFLVSQFWGGCITKFCPKRKSNTTRHLQYFFSHFAAENLLEKPATYVKIPVICQCRCQISALHKCMQELSCQAAWCMVRMPLIYTSMEKQYGYYPEITWGRMHPGHLLGLMGRMCNYKKGLSYKCPLR